MIPGTETDEYVALLVDTQPRSISSEEDAQIVQGLINGLIDKVDPPSEAERELLSLFGDVLMAWEGDRYDPPTTSPLERLQALIEDNGLKQADLVGPVFPNKAVASDVINGKRRLTYSHVQKLSTFFHVPADIFFSQEAG